VGVNFVRSIVEGENCTFTEVPLENDLGLDAHVEFTHEESATGCCIGMQIKSGPSYLSADGSRFVFHTDRDHFEYWQSHLLPVAAIFYDPVTKASAWLDITQFLATNPRVISEGPYSIAAPISQAFTAERFSGFCDHFLPYREQYRQDTNFALALEKFADTADEQECYDGLLSLFSFHRHRLATWYYVISCFRNFRGHVLLDTLTKALCHVPGHPDISWGPANTIDRPVRNAAEMLMRARFGREEVLALLEAIDENGLTRGEAGQCAHAIIDIVAGRDQLLEDIAFDEATPDDARFYALLLLIYYAQAEEEPCERCIRLVEDYLARFPYHDVVGEVLWTIREFGGLSFY